MCVDVGVVLVGGGGSDGGLGGEETSIHVY